MRKRKCILVFLLAAGLVAGAQDRYFTKTGKITFLSTAPMENIEAVNKTAGAILDAKTGAVQFAVLMKGFEFKKALMQEHFNENYVESSQYPKAEFRGTVVNNANVNYDRDGSYPVSVKGQLTIHGVTKQVETPALLQVQAGKIAASTSFSILLSDYRISIPSLVKDKVSNNVKIVVDAALDALKM